MKFSCIFIWTCYWIFPFGYFFPVKIPVRLYVWTVAEDLDDLENVPQLDSWDKITYINRPVEVRKEGKVDVPLSILFAHEEIKSFALCSLIKTFELIYFQHDNRVKFLSKKFKKVALFLFPVKTFSQIEFTTC